MPPDDPAVVDTYGSVYLEHGLTPRLTLGLDAGTDPGADGSAIVFLRRPVDFGGQTHRFAVQVGMGAARSAGGTDALLQLGASWGRGLETRFGPGWAVVDVSTLYNPARETVAAKADLTLGIRPDERTKLMLQFQSGDYPGSDPYLRVVPLVARKFGARVHVEMGARLGLAGDERVGVKLGTWLEF